MKPQHDDAPAIELRVLYGPQAGSRMPLARGEYLLGRSDACDVVLASSRMEDRHALLVIDDHGIRLRPQDGRIRDALGNEAVEELMLAKGMPVEFGGVSIVVDEIDAPWPDERATAPITQPPAAVAPEKSEAQPAAVAQARQWRRQLAGVPIPLVFAGAGLAGACLIALVLVRSFQSESLAAPTAHTPVAQPEIHEPPDAMVQALRSLDPERLLSVSRQEDLNWLVAGYVATDARKKAIVDKLAMVTPEAILKIHSEEAILRAAREALSAREDSDEANLEVERAGKGRLRLVGAARRASSVQSAKLALLVVTGVSDVEVSVLLPEQLLARLKERIEAAGLGTRLSFTKEWPEVVVEGSVDAAGRARWNELLNGYTRDYGAVLPVRATLAEVTPQAPFSVKTIVGGASPYIVTQQGVRVNRGGTLNGSRLVSVNDGEAVFDGAQRWQIGR